MKRSTFSTSLRLAAGVALLALSTPTFAVAQRHYIDHRTYPADFAAIDVGDSVADRPGYVWRHDGRGWYHELVLPSGPPPEVPASTCPKIIVSYYILLTCATRPPLPVDPWTGGTFSFAVGQLYGWTYPQEQHRLLVISVALDVDSLRRIVTGRRLRDGQTVGDPIAFFEDEAGGWVPLPPP